jgi:GNAT superfamily N-acetyltransferase
MSRSAPDTCERLPWDSDFFGVAIARVTQPRATAGDLAAAVRWAGQASINCLYFLADADHHESVRAAEENRFALVDARATLERGVPAAEGGDDASVRLATLEDLPRLTSIARVSHRNTRFHRDTRFDARRADEMYAVWIERAMRGEMAAAVWVVDQGDGPLGYLAVSRDAGCASIGLVAIDASCRGLGYGGRLIRTALRWAAGQNLTRMSVVTQGHEAPALRFYESSGFTARRVQLWYHYWSRRPSSAGSQ